MNKEKFEDEKFKKTIRNIFPKIKPGLNEGKKLYEDGLMNLSIKEINFLLNGSELSNAVLIYLMILIQAYPGDTIEYEGDEDYHWTKALEFLLGSVIAQKEGLLILETQENKINPDSKMKVKMTEKGMQLGFSIKSQIQNENESCLL